MSIHRRGKKGTYHAVVYSHGKHKWKSLKTNDRKLAKLRHLEYARRNAQPDPLKPIIWLDFCKKYLEYSETNKKESTFKFDKMVIHLFNRTFHLDSIGDFKPKLIEEFKIKLSRKSLAPSSVNRYINILKSMGKKAFEWELTNENRYPLVKAIPEPEHEKGIFTPDQVKKIMGVAKDEFETIFLAFCLLTGMRRNEIRNLRWSDIDFERNIIKIVAKGDWSPKGYRSRIVPLARQLKQMLLHWRHTNKGEYVVSPAGKLMNRWYHSLKFKRILARKNCGIPGSIHMARHTWITNLALAGANIYSVQRWAGHRSIKTTSKIYTHVLPEMGAEQIDLLLLPLAKTLAKT